MKKLILSLFVMIHGLAFADLAQRTRLEDLIRDRAQNTMRIFDHEAQVYVQIRLKDLKGQMPGGLFEVSGHPSNPDLDDIAQVLVTVYSVSEKAPDGAEGALFTALGLPKGALKIEFKKWEFPPVEDTSKLTSQSISKVADTFVDGLGSKISLAVLILGVAVFGSSLVFAWMHVREVRQQTTALVAAAQASVSARETAAPAPVAQAAVAEAASAGPIPAGRTTDIDVYLANLGFDSLAELFGDCYWCELDGYAHYMWRTLPVEKREELLSKLDFIVPYVPYFFAARPQNMGLHEHPYYLNPEKLFAVSQADVKAQVAKTPALWLKLSPMRQQRLEINLETKLGAASGKITSTSLKIDGKPSKPRTLPVTADFGDPTLEDEVSMFQNPDFVPAELRSRIRSLVWLALCDDAVVTEALLAFDARSLAQAWIGPQEVLARLESCVAPAKLELLKDYAAKNPPSRRSTPFIQLVQAGLNPAPATEGFDEKAAA